MEAAQTINGDRRQQEYLAGLTPAASQQISSVLTFAKGDEKWGYVTAACKSQSNQKQTTSLSNYRALTAIGWWVINLAARKLRTVQRLKAPWSARARLIKRLNYRAQLGSSISYNNIVTPHQGLMASDL